MIDHNEQAYDHQEAVIIPTADSPRPYAHLPQDAYDVHRLPTTLFNRLQSFSADRHYVRVNLTLAQFSDLQPILLAVIENGPSTILTFGPSAEQTVSLPVALSDVQATNASNDVTLVFRIVSSPGSIFNRPKAKAPEVHDPAVPEHNEDHDPEEGDYED